MSAAPGERTALLVIRAWIEANDEGQLRARITHTTLAGPADEAWRVVASKEEIKDAVAEWLDQFVGDGALTKP